MERKINLFVVDDEPAFRALMAQTFSSDKYHLDVFSSGEDILQAGTGYDVGLIDLKMPRMDGIELLKEAKKRNVAAEFVILTGNATVENAIEAMKLGCYEYLTKPIRIDALEKVVQEAYEKTVWNTEKAEPRKIVRSLPEEKYDGIIGKSQKMKSVFALIDKVGTTSSTVLVTGESGTGKELVARALHNKSNRQNEPFVILDCASVSDALLENELFGHEKGAFTDATSVKRGLFELADTGTIFIDEIGEMKLATQAKLLRVIETQQFRRLGGTQEIKVDVRIIAATNRKLTDEINKGNFREDLFYRLNVFNIHLPALRDRKEDIPLLVRHFLANSQIAPGKRIREEDISALMNYDWPGNVRELANVIESALITSSDDYITPADFSIDFHALPCEISELYSHEKGLNAFLGELEIKLLTHVLNKCNGNKIATAKYLKISRANLYRKLGKYGLLRR